ncbi:MAG: aminomethyl-transferring glycine dehydrogenase [Verrucomicrobiia bacterium]|jgi:glycine dehydrogenase
MKFNNAKVDYPENFVSRHIGPRPEEIQQMAIELGANDLDDLVSRAMPSHILARQTISLPEPISEHAALERLQHLASRNQPLKSFIGMGYYDCFTPSVIQRNIFENPGWYTQYTPYQAEISQGRLEALLIFQTMVRDLTALEIANASLLDEATACAEAMRMCHRLKKNPLANRFIISDDCHPQNISVVKTHSEAIGVELIVTSLKNFTIDETVFGILIQYPSTKGDITDLESLIQTAHNKGALVAVATDLMALLLIKPPGEFGADIAIGSAQRFGVPMGFGGPHAGFLATRDAFKRQMPGRLVGISKDSRGKPAYRLALGTREQHIRREKATSNICTAQSLPAIMSAMYAVYHGPQGLKKIAEHINKLAAVFANGVKQLGYTIHSESFFDTVCVKSASANSNQLAKIAIQNGVNIRVIDETTTAVSFDETKTLDDARLLLKIYNNNQEPQFFERLLNTTLSPIPPHLIRTSQYLTNPVFNSYHSETAMLRYLRKLESRDLSLTASMIPLGSCTMKLNPASAMMPLSWQGFNRLHPYAPAEQTCGYAELLKELGDWLLQITGFSGICFQPTAGSQGEYTGLLIIRAYHKSRNQAHRDVCLIPQSAHGTNPASAAMAGFSVISVLCDKNGNIDIEDLRQKAQQNKDRLAALMVTYPSTHGVFEDSIIEVCKIIHQNGGQVYMDGANMNALAGLCRPVDIGADVCHLNLHKTFAIPHGGGGPGAGPVCVAKHLVPFLPSHPLEKTSSNRVGAVSSSPFGSALILTISWFYIATLGLEGIRQSSKVAILNANYIAKKLEPFFPILYRGQNNMVAHECILDMRKFKYVTVEDVAKRLMDYGFHAPTVSWPVPGTIMVEPTESEPKSELDRFCKAMISIYKEICEIESGAVDKLNNLLKNAPHTADTIASDNWNKPYTRERAAFPASWLYDFKFWPPVGRVDNVLGDRYPVCACQ